MKRYEYKVIDTGKRVEAKLNELGAQGWRVVGVTTKKQLFIAPPQAVILMRRPRLGRQCVRTRLASRFSSPSQPWRPATPTPVR